jgi:hypothetical protein
MKFLRILPEICASTTCSLPSRRTLKNALGNLSTMTPSAGIRSSLDKQTAPYSLNMKPHLLDAAASKTGASIFDKTTPPA